MGSLLKWSLVKLTKLRSLGCKATGFVALKSTAYVPGSKVAFFWGDGRPPTFNDGNPYDGYINPYYWVDEFILYYMEI